MSTGTRTSDETFRTKTTHGCHDDGLLFAAVTREIGIPAVMVDANGVNWIEAQRSEKKTHGYWTMRKGIDLWSYGIHSLKDLQSLQTDHARLSDPSSLRPPHYSIKHL